MAVTDLDRMLACARDNAKALLAAALSGHDIPLHTLDDALIARLLNGPHLALWRAVAAQRANNKPIDPIAAFHATPDPSAALASWGDLDHYLFLARDTAARDHALHTLADIAHTLGGLRMTADLRAGIIAGDGAAALEQLRAWNSARADDGLTLLDIPAAIDAAQHPIPWMFTGYCCYGDTVLLGGSAAAGKSWLGYDLAFAALRAERDAALHFLGEPVPVVIIDQEQAPRLIGHRLRKIALARGLPDSWPADLPLHYVPPMQLDLTSGRAVHAVMRLVSRTQARLAIIDSAVRVAPRIDWNDAAAVAAFFASAITPLALDTGATVLVIAHLRKANPLTREDSKDALQDRLRGSSDIPAAVNQVWTLQRDHEDQRTLTATKSRWGQEPSAITLDYTDTAEGGLRILEVAREDDALHVALEIITAAGPHGARRADIVDKLTAAGAGTDAATKAAQRALAKLCATKRAVRSGSTRTTRFYAPNWAPESIA
jgi:hypothetical protein